MRRGFYRIGAPGRYSTILAPKASQMAARSPSTPRLAFVAATTTAARAAKAALEQRYGVVPPAEADVMVALGGDGLMLQALHRNMKRKSLKCLI